MRSVAVRSMYVLSAGVAMAFLSACGGSAGIMGERDPQFGTTPLQLTLVDGTPLPVMISSTALDQTTVTGGKATLGEAISGGPFTLSLRRTSGMTSTTSTVSGTASFSVNGSLATATIDLGTGLGTHTYTFAR
jgi:hypothetical protein